VDPFILIHLAKTTKTFVAMAAQPRRIACEHCHEVFVYLATQKLKASIEDWRSTADATFAARGDGQLRLQAEKFASKPRRGAALCPSCKRYQPWMVRDSWLRPLLWSGGVCGAVGLLASFTLGFIEYVNDASSVEWEALVAIPLAAFAAGLVPGALWAIVFGLRPGAHLERADARALDEAGFRELGAVGSDYAARVRRWFDRSGGRLGRGVTLLPLPLRDDAGARSA